jgi:transposase
MAVRKHADAKLDALRETGTVNPRPELVRDEPFLQVEFFDARDLLQVKYEMIRRVRVDGTSVTEAADAFGMSRPSFYAAQAAYTHGGLAALLPRKRGPRGGHKLIPEIVHFLDELRATDTTLAASKLVPMVKERFGVEVHPRTIERALRRLEKKRR